MGTLTLLGSALGSLLLLVAIYDYFFSQDNVLRNFPVIGHIRYWLITIGPELRQYIVANNREEAPFNRDEREWVYRSAKGENNYFGFGTDDQVYGIGYPIIKPAAFPFGEEGYTASVHDKNVEIPSAKVLGEAHDRRLAWRPRSIINISAMSFGSLSANAVSALNLGAKQAGCFHNTGEGGISPYHDHGADLIWQIGTAKFGCRTLEGAFSMEKLQANLENHPYVRGLEIKLSQGAKPGKGGVLPAAKINPEIAEIRGIREDEDCVSPNAHREFNDVPSMIQFIEDLAKQTGLPVGIKAAIGHLNFWRELAQKMKSTGQGPDWIAIDGGEGGTGSAPLTFTDHVALPYKLAFTRVYRIFLEEGVADHVTWIGSGKLGFPDRAIVAIALGADMINIAREAMLAIGCIQAQKCHTDHCPTGVATQNPHLQRGLKPELQAARYQRFCQSLRNEIQAVTHACGYEHPSQFTTDDIELSSGPGQFSTLRDLYQYYPSRQWRPFEQQDKHEEINQKAA